MVTLPAAGFGDDRSRFGAALGIEGILLSVSAGSADVFAFYTLLLEVLLQLDQEVGKGGLHLQKKSSDDLCGA